MQRKLLLSFKILSAPLFMGHLHAASATSAIEVTADRDEDPSLATLHGENIKVSLPLILDDKDTEENQIFKTADLLLKSSEYFFEGERYISENMEYYLNYISAIKNETFALKVLQLILDNWNTKIELPYSGHLSIVNQFSRLSFAAGDVSRGIFMLMIHYLNSSVMFPDKKPLSDFASFALGLNDYAPYLSKSLILWVGAQRKKIALGVVSSDTEICKQLHSIYQQWLDENNPVSVPESELTPEQIIISKFLRTNGRLKGLDFFIRVALDQKQIIIDRKQNFTQHFGDLFSYFFHRNQSNRDILGDELKLHFVKKIKTFSTLMPYESILEKFGNFIRENKESRPDLIENLDNFKRCFIGMLTVVAPPQAITSQFADKIANLFICDAAISNQRITKLIEQIFTILCSEPEKQSEIDEKLRHIKEEYPHDYALAELMARRRMELLESKGYPVSGAGVPSKVEETHERLLETEEETKMMIQIHDLLAEMYKLPTDDIKGKRKLREKLAKLKASNKYLYDSVFNLADASASCSLEEAKSAAATALEETAEDTMKRLGLLSDESTISGSGKKKKKGKLNQHILSSVEVEKQEREIIKKLYPLVREQEERRQSAHLIKGECAKLSNHKLYEARGRTIEIEISKLSGTEIGRQALRAAKAQVEKDIAEAKRIEDENTAAALAKAEEKARQKQAEDEAARIAAAAEKREKEAAAVVKAKLKSEERAKAAAKKAEVEALEAAEREKVEAIERAAIEATARAAIRTSMMERLAHFNPICSISFENIFYTGSHYSLEFSPAMKEASLTIYPRIGSPELFSIPVESILDDYAFMTFLKGDGRIVGMEESLNQRLSNISDESVRQAVLQYNAEVVQILYKTRAIARHAIGFPIS